SSSQRNNVASVKGKQPKQPSPEVGFRLAPRTAPLNGVVELAGPDAAPLQPRLGKRQSVLHVGDGPAGPDHRVTEVPAPYIAVCEFAPVAIAALAETRGLAVSDKLH